MSTIKLYYTDRNDTYKEWELIPSKLFVVEDIASYLASKSALTISNVQYIKNELEIGLTLDLSQTYAQPKSALNFKYVSIQNTDELIHYYFVKKVIWRSKDAVRFELVLDVLNTFEENKDYTFKSNTRIIREHKDRFKIGAISVKLTFTGVISSSGTLNVDDVIGLSRGGTLIPQYVGRVADKSLTYITLNFIAGAFDYEDFETYIGDYANDIAIRKTPDIYLRVSGVEIAETTNKYIRLIDYINENINPPLIHGNATLIENNEEVLAQDWYLLYRNQNNPTESLVNPVECYLIPENETPVDYGVITSGKITATSLVRDKYYYFRITEKDYNYDPYINQSITLPDGTTYDGSSMAMDLGVYGILYRNDGNKLNLLICDDAERVLAVYYDLEFIQLDNLPFKYVEESYFDWHDLYESTIWNDEEDWSDTLVAPKCYPVSDLDRTDAKNIKLIKLPYVPFDFSINSDDELAIDNITEWDYTSFTQSSGVNFYALKLDDLNMKLKSTIVQDDSPFDNLNITYPASASINDLRITSVETESKMFHSEFYRPTYVYDSFQFSFQLEKLAINNYADHESLETSIRFDMTSTINSKFMFSFTNLHYDLPEQNYYKVMPIARNNEEVLYNVPYINYIRTGFNYDVKAKEIAKTSNRIGLGLSIASIGASLLLPSAPLKVAGIVASVVSMAMSIKNTIVSEINNENSLQQKMNALQNQATSVAGSDDVDLMSVYAGNRISYMEYVPNPLMKSLLKDLFFYAGYNSGRMGLPNHNTRLNFDYLECEASIEAISSIPQECLEELVNCFKNGVSYIHKTGRTLNKWDFEQAYENWENWLFS